MISKAVFEGVGVAILVAVSIAMLLRANVLEAIVILLLIVVYHLRVIASQQRGQTELLALIAEGQDA
ncbi:MAG: hypothetical protein NTX33_19960 [Propionibacteriales bacterium]|nr:hypothetical protein [Propionibacteriales bacterium]